ncbi:MULTISPECIES: hypothetical protein [Streptomyces violaceusniger group]|uniref:Uncharacterized protein n=1 Tax=Streptomyces malaysiensis TaxID=92644 RepID=A0A2J7Z9T2_STRMQ|nr:hypothetical protein [Streptomyces malaysiensis]PNG97031.1 hypothetical protein SMF913_13056 [Streptomyces malaysiensis]
MQELRYKTVGGAIVTIADDPQATRLAPIARAKCGGCRDFTHDYADEPDGGMRRLKKWASDHAAACRALPQSA